MAEPIGQADYDFLARKMGFKDMQEVREKRKEEEAAAYRAKMEAEEKARQEERRRIREAEDLEISMALESGRMIVELDGSVPVIRAPADLICPQCEKPFSFARDLLLQAVRRATMDKERRTRWSNHSPYGAIGRIIAGYDVIGSLNYGPGMWYLYNLSPVLLFRGEASCPDCGKKMQMAVQVQVELDGELLRGIGKEARPSGRKRGEAHE